jgi:folate-binding protein YgfZ
MSFIFIINALEQTSTVLRIRGSDAYTYLQGQFTQDLSPGIGSAAYGLWLNQRGKVVADSFVLRRNDNDFIAACFSAGPERLRSRLEAYLIADEVELTEETGEWARLSVWGEGVAEHVSGIFGPAPAAGRFSEGEAGVWFHGRNSAVENFECLVARAALPALAARLTTAGGQLVGADVAARERILAAIPAVPTDIGEGDLPNEGGLEASAISYTKGCYLGQEVMARLKNLGQVRRRLHVVRGPGATPTERQPLFQGGRKVGEVRSVAPDGGGFVAMAMLSLVNLEPVAGLATSAEGPPTLAIVSRV